MKSTIQQPQVLATLFEDFKGQQYLPKALLNELNAKKRRHLRWRLVSFFTEALKTTANVAQPVEIAWILLFKAVCLFDKYIDDDCIIEDNKLSLSDRIEINFGGGLICAVSQQLLRLAQFGVCSSKVIEVQNEFYKMAYTIFRGQHDDITTTVGHLEHCWATIGAKSGTFFALATRCGALLATDDEQTIFLASRIGYQLGVLLQISDDYWDMWGNREEKSDIHGGNFASLPIAYTFSVLGVRERTQLQNLFREAHRSPQDEQAVRKVLIDSGAVLYMVIMSHSHAKMAKNLINEIQIGHDRKRELNDYVDSLILQPLL